MTKAEEIARNQIKLSSTTKLLELWETTTTNNDPHISIVRGWLLDEFEERNQEGFEKWLDTDAEDETLRKYILN
jgi:hypothetical protein